MLLLLLLLAHLPSIVSTPAEAQTPLEALEYVDEAFLQKTPVLVWGDDPFLKVPGYEDPAPGSVYKLDALVYSPDHPKAMINGQIVEVGTALKDGSLVESIGPNYVVVRKDQSLRQLTTKGRVTAQAPVNTPERRPSGR